MPRLHKVLSSKVLSQYLVQRNYPAWTAFYVKRSDVRNDQWGKSHFNWEIDSINYNILRTGAWPFVKYHCTKAPKSDLRHENMLLGALKVCNLGFPCLIYGVAGYCLAKHEDVLFVEGRTITLYFWYKETW